MSSDYLTFHMRHFRMQRNPIVIGLHSSVGKSGKDTLCEMLNAERFAFGDALKVETARALTDNQEEYALILSAFHNQKLKDVPDSSLAIKRIPQGFWSSYLYSQWNPSLDPSAPRSPRWHIQQYGTMRRNQDVDYWVKVVADQIEDFNKETESFRTEFIIVTDVRMPNELQMVRNLGGQVFSVKRTWHDPLDDVPKHSSDTALDGYDIPVINNIFGNPEGMLEQLKEYLNER